MGGRDPKRIKSSNETTIQKRRSWSRKNVKLTRESKVWNPRSCFRRDLNSPENDLSFAIKFELSLCVLPCWAVRLGKKQIRPHQTAPVNQDERHERPDISLNQEGDKVLSAKFPWCFFFLKIFHHSMLDCKPEATLSYVPYSTQRIFIINITTCLRWYR